MKKRDKRLIYERQAEIIKALSHPIRIAIIDYLKNGEQCVCDIAKTAGAERTGVSKHLSVMTSAGVLTCRKDGLKMFYKLKTPCILDCLECITKCLKEKAKEDQKLLSSL